MEKYEQINALYARRSELTLATVTLEDRIVNSISTDRLAMLKELRNLHYEEFMLEYEIKAVLEPEKSKVWNLITRFAQ